MSVIGEKISEIMGKVTSTTVTEAGNSVNLEIEAGPFGLVSCTTTFGAPLDVASETGPISERGCCFLADGSFLPYTGVGTWRTSGHHKWEVKLINLAADGQRVFAVYELELATRSIKGTIYALD